MRLGIKYKHTKQKSWPYEKTAAPAWHWYVFKIKTNLRKKNKQKKLPSPQKKVILSFVFCFHWIFIIFYLVHVSPDILLNAFFRCIFLLLAMWSYIYVSKHPLGIGVFPLFRNLSSHFTLKRTPIFTENTAFTIYIFYYTTHF